MTTVQLTGDLSDLRVGWTLGLRRSRFAFAEGPVLGPPASDPMPDPIRSLFPSPDSRAVGKVNRCTDERAPHVRKVRRAVQYIGLATLQPNQRFPASFYPLGAH